jgi:hypothetical protein
VVPEPGADELRVGLANLPTDGQFEEGNGGVLVAICHNDLSFILLYDPEPQMCDIRGIYDLRSFQFNVLGA